MYKTIIIILMTLFYNYGHGQKVTLSGQIRDQATGEDLINATIQIENIGTGTISNAYGFYSLTLDQGDYIFVYSFLGYEVQRIEISLLENTIQNIELAESTAILGEVVITAESEIKEQHIQSTNMSKIDIDIESVKKIPALFGEIDIIKAIQLLPGVKSIGEGSSGFYVRGGNADQNLVLLDEAPLYNPSHLLGFFSSFNPEAIKDMELYKGAIPAHFGGRLSSVLDIRMKEGNAKMFGASGGIGSIMSRLAVEAPIGKNGSFIVAGRRSYLDLIAKTYFGIFKKDQVLENDFFFYDLNAKVNFRINNNNRIFASGYFGRDVIRDDNEGIELQWGNKTGTVRWNHIFSPKLFSNLTYYYSNYDYFLDFEEDVTRFKWISKLKEHSLKADLGAYINPSNTLRFGIHSISHNISPGDITSFEDVDIKEELTIQKNKSIESALYVSHDIEVSDKLKIDYGIRLSSLHNIGPQDVYEQNENYQVTDTTHYNSGVYNSYWNLEPRIALRYKLNDNHSIKASYNRTTQYIQMASNGNTATPFDIWFSSSKYVKPQLADQYAIGFFKSFDNLSYELSVELYYKKLYNSVDFKDHARLLLNRNLENELRIGEGRSYGIEFMLKKNIGKLSGWVSYTYSRSEKKIPTINNEEWYNAKYDKPHDFAIVATYDISDHISLGSNFVYSTGSAVTFPTGKYNYFGSAIPIYSERNATRLPDYHRLDLSMTLKNKKNKFRRFQSEWVFSIYNAYNRKNAFQIRFKQDEQNSNVTYAEKSSIFSIVPSITYNAKF